MFYSQIKFFSLLVALTLLPEWKRKITSLCKKKRDSWWWHCVLKRSTIAPTFPFSPCQEQQERSQFWVLRRKFLIKFINDENGSFLSENLRWIGGNQLVFVHQRRCFSSIFDIKTLALNSFFSQFWRRKTLLCQSTQTGPEIRSWDSARAGAQLMLIINEHAIVIYSDTIRKPKDQKSQY